MLRRYLKLAVSFPSILITVSAVQALEDGGAAIADAHVWRIENVVVRRFHVSRPIYSLERTQTWASGLSPVSRFTPYPSGKSLGAKMQPFQDWNFMIGTELTRSGGEGGFLASRTMWESTWSRDLTGMGGLRIDFSTVGSMDNAQADYLQSFNGRLNLPLDLPLSQWNVALRVSPSMNVDVSNGALYSNLLSEIMGERVLSSYSDAYRSSLNVSVGYSVAPNARPAASARLEFRISPNM